jgi:hypothetical protein
MTNRNINTGDMINRNIQSGGLNNINTNMITNFLMVFYQLFRKVICIKCMKFHR